MKPETRTLYERGEYRRDGWGFSHKLHPVVQSAIPRCIAHNMGGLMIDSRCVVGQMVIDDPLSEEPDGCVISRGGPDHKWWRDA